MRTKLIQKQIDISILFLFETSFRCATKNPFGMCSYANNFKIRNGTQLTSDPLFCHIICDRLFCFGFSVHSFF